MRTNFQMEYQNITMVKGDTVAFNVIVYDDAGEPVHVDEAYLTCKKNVNLLYNLFQKELNSGITQESDGVMIVRIAPEDTIGAEIGNYYYDLQIVVGEDVFTLMIGTLTIGFDVTE